MVVRRTIERLKERPEHERSAVAGSIAVAVVAILLVGWSATFLRGFSSAGQAASANASAADAASGPALQWQVTSGAGVDLTSSSSSVTEASY